MFPYTLPKTLEAVATYEPNEVYLSFDVLRTAGNRRRIAQVTIYPNGGLLAVRAALHNATEYKAWTHLALLLGLDDYETLTGYATKD